MSADAPSRDSVLVVEDDPTLSELVAIALEEAGFETIVESDGGAALERTRSQQFSLILLDLLLPSVDGLEICRQVRRESQVPILIITAKGETGEIVEGLDCGADDYLVKPFEVDELLARVRAVLRRRDAAARPVLQFEDLEIDPAAVTVRRHGEEVHLTATEFRLLLTLAEAPRQVFSREALLREVWGYEYLGDSGIVNMAIKRLRGKIEDDPSDPRLVHTVRGFGYRFDPS